ncbi:SAM-dependent methyltransferase [Neisseria dumasiana]|uniref:SAM-dependent methyltransferase n=1 Tax=Neisseria dumasiana TaxID=1931275 RepID=A0A1X3DI07_9NEIS|nr:SAM-dependent methyltransferase [Neisseria dumasiana]OSI20433.1 SAM-dependent methyltransferase [Neisseria dumasiana]
MMVLDPASGSRMMYFDKNDQRVLFGDIRQEEHILKDRHYNRTLEVKPDVKLDFTKLPFDSGSFRLVVFDPPHLVHAGDKSWLAKKYGRLGENWQTDIKAGFSECFRVLEEGGILIFKWNENQIRVKDILALTDQKPLFGHVTMKHKKNQTATHWFTFIKETENE